MAAFSNDAKIVIVGAGAAGLAAADRLWSKGFRNIVVLEAQARIGGRIYSKVYDSGEFVELGAQWIHGEDHAVYRFAKDAKLVLEKRRDCLLDEDEATGDFVLDCGRRVTDDEKDIVEDTLRFLNAAIAEIDSTPDKEATMADFETVLRSKFESFLLSMTNPSETSLRRATFDWILRYQLVDNSCAYLKDLSVRAFTDYELEGDVTVRLNAPLTSFLDHLTKDLPRTVVQLSKVVQKIAFRPGEPSPVEIRCEDGSIYEAHHVIVTVSLGVLKASSALFDPLLTENKLAAIKHGGFGSICKIILVFPRAFWTTLPSGWQTDGFQPLWVDHFSELRSSAMEDVPWYRWALGFDAVRTKANALVLWVAGPVTLQLDEMADDLVARDAIDLLRRFTGDPEIPFPVEVIREKWTSNAFTRGTYSYFSLDASTRGIELEDFSEPEWSTTAGDGRPAHALLFAGEATCPLYFSTIHGAILSGWREADRICKFYSAP